MKRHVRSSKETPYGPTEVAVARAERPSTYSLSRNHENDCLHRPPLPYSYSRSPITSRNRFAYGEDEVSPVLHPLPSQERVPLPHFPRTADLVPDDRLQRWKMIEEDREYVRDDGRGSRTHNISRYDRQAVVGSAGVPRQSPPPYHHGDYGMKSSFVPPHSHYGRDVAIVSPIFDDYGEQSLSSRNSLQRSTNEWDELKPPPFRANDHLYHHNQYQKEEEPYYHRSSTERSYSTDRSSGSRDYHSSKPPATMPTAKMMEISPGSFVRLRGADETYQAVANDFYTPCQCMVCTSTTSRNKYHRQGDEEPLFCIQDADFFLCPNCKTINPLEDDASNKRSGGAGGVGLGFTLEMLIKIQEEVLANRSTAR